MIQTDWSVLTKTPNNQTHEMENEMKTRAPRRRRRHLRSEIRPIGREPVVTIDEVVAQLVYPYVHGFDNRREREMR